MSSVGTWIKTVFVDMEPEMSAIARLAWMYVWDR